MYPNHLEVKLALTLSRGSSEPKKQLLRSMSDQRRNAHEERDQRYVQDKFGMVDGSRPYNIALQEAVTEAKEGRRIETRQPCGGGYRIIRKRLGSS